MSKPQQNLKPVNLSQTIPRLFKHISKCFNLKKDESIFLMTSFYSSFFWYRYENNMFDKKEVFISKIDYKKILFRTHKNLKFKKKISYQNLERLFFRKKYLAYEITNLNIPLKNGEKEKFIKDLKDSTIYINQHILNLAYSVITEYHCRSGKKSVPFELVVIVIFDVYYTYNRRKELFQNVRRGLTIHRCISGVYDQRPRYGTFGIELIRHMFPNSTITDEEWSKFGNDSTEVSERLYPKFTKGKKVPRLIEVPENIESLSKLCAFYGHKTWYKFFYKAREENYDEYYKFSEPNFIESISTGEYTYLDGS